MDLYEHVERFTRDVLADALLHAEARYWLRRASAFEAATDREDDYTGRATPEAMEARRERLAAVALACRNHADFLTRRGAA